MSRTIGKSGRAAGSRRGAAAGLAGLALAALALAACGGGGRTTADEPLGQFLRGTTQPAAGLDPAEFRAPAPCPRVQLLPDTETIRVTRGGNDLEPGVLVYQARIDDTARECTPAGEATAVRVGIRGRALSGPEGPAGTVRLPLRVAVREGGEVTYSRLHRVEVTLTAAEPARNFAFVDEGVRVSDPTSAEILVGFDEGGR